MVVPRSYGRSLPVRQVRSNRASAGPAAAHVEQRRAHWILVLRIVPRPAPGAHEGGPACRPTCRAGLDGRRISAVASWTSNAAAHSRIARRRPTVGLGADPCVTDSLPGPCRGTGPVPAEGTRRSTPRGTGRDRGGIVSGPSLMSDRARAPAPEKAVQRPASHDGARALCSAVRAPTVTAPAARSVAPAAYHGRRAVPTGNDRRAAFPAPGPGPCKAGGRHSSLGGRLTERGGRMPRRIMAPPREPPPEPPSHC